MRDVLIKDGGDGENGGRLEMCLIPQECYGAKLLHHFKKKTPVVSNKESVS